MILAAGLGTRMRPLTDILPKPLLVVGGKPLIQYHIERLQRAGITEVVVNLAYRGQQIRDFLGEGENFGVKISYSEEGEPLETAGAILKAAPLLGSEPFLLVNADIWTDYDINLLLAEPLPPTCAGRLLLVSNPDHHPRGDFSCSALGSDGDSPVDSRACANNTTLMAIDERHPGLTFSGISLLRPQLVTEYPQARLRFPLAECFRYALADGRLQAQVYTGQWWDIGTPERLQALDQLLIGGG